MAGGIVILPGLPGGPPWSPPVPPAVVQLQMEAERAMFRRLNDPPLRYIDELRVRETLGLSPRPQRTCLPPRRAGPAKFLASVARQLGLAK